MLCSAPSCCCPPPLRPTTTTCLLSLRSSGCCLLCSALSWSGLSAAGVLHRSNNTSARQFHLVLLLLSTTTAAAANIKCVDCYSTGPTASFPCTPKTPTRGDQIPFCSQSSLEARSCCLVLSQPSAKHEPFTYHGGLPRTHWPRSLLPWACAALRRAILCRGDTRVDAG